MEQSSTTRHAATGPGLSILVISVGVLIAVTFFGAGMMAQDAISRGHDLLGFGDAIGGLTSDDGATTGDRVDEVRRLIEQEYYYLPADEEALEEFQRTLEYNAIRGMTEGLEDDYTTFLVPVEHAPVAEELSGEYEGIGVWVEYPDGQFTIVAPMPGSPAEKAGLQAGDVILQADGRPLVNVAEEDAVDLVRGPAGSTVVLTVLRPGVEEPFDVEVIRDRITMPAVSYEWLPATKTAHIRVTIFGDKTTEQLDAAIARAEEDGAAGIVIDLRNNGGGWVRAAQEMIGRFIAPDRGPALYEDLSVEESDLESLGIIAGDVHAYDLPVALLVNGGTASAAEIVAGALRDYDRAVIVGEKTFGKGSVQRVHEFPDGSSARITFALWLTPSKIAIEGAGIEPDITVPSGDDSQDGDPQLEAAIEALGRERPRDAGEISRTTLPGDTARAA